MVGQFIDGHAILPVKEVLGDGIKHFVGAYKYMLSKVEMCKLPSSYIWLLFDGPHLRPIPLFGNEILPGVEIV